MPFMHRSDIDIYYELHGQGPPLVLIMGLRRNAQWWYQQIPAFSKHFRVLVFDNRGSGRSSQPDTPYSIALLAADAIALLEHLNIGRADILGYSMGGYIAQELAIRRPEMVRRLVLVSTGAGGASGVRMAPEQRREFENVAGLSPAEALQKNLFAYFSPAYSDSHPQEMARFMEVSLRHLQAPQAFLRQYQACLEHDTTGRLGQVTAPALIMAGNEDPVLPPANAHILKQLLPQAELQLFPGGRHSFMLQMPAEFNRAVLRFLGAEA